MSRTKTEEHIRQIMAPLNPVPPEAFSGSWRDAQGRATYERILADHTQRAPHSRGLGLRRRPALSIAVLASLAVVAALVVPRFLDQTGSSATATPPALDYQLTGAEQPLAAAHLPSARPVLLRLAHLAARQPVPVQLRSANVGYVLTREWNMTVAVAGGSSAAALTPQIDQTWTSPYGSFRQVEHRGQPQLIGAGTQATEQAVASAPALRSLSGRTTAQFGPAVQHLSTNPALLVAALQHSAPAYTFPATPEPYYLAETIAAVNHEHVSPQLTAAFWRVLAAEPNVSYLGSVVDRAGRPGDAIAASFGGRGHEQVILIISPSTGMLLDEEDMFMTNPGKLTIKQFPAVVGYIVYLRQGWTANMRTPAP